MLIFITLHACFLQGLRKKIDFVNSHGDIWNVDVSQTLIGDNSELINRSLNSNSGFFFKTSVSSEKRRWCWCWTRQWKLASALRLRCRTEPPPYSVPFAGMLQKLMDCLSACKSLAVETHRCFPGIRSTCSIPLHGHATACLSVPSGGIFDLYTVWGDSEQSHYIYLWTGFTDHCFPFILVKSPGVGIPGGAVGV